MRLSALLFLFIALTACPKESIDAQVGAIGKAKTAARQASARVNSSQANEIGIEECDAYIRNYESCLAEKVPEEKRDALRATLDEQRKRWQASVTAGEDQAPIKRQCESEIETAKRAMSDYGCTF
jgi:hypothetical protein